MRNRLYVLDSAGMPVVEPDVLKWGAWFETERLHSTLSTPVETPQGTVRVSTVFLGCDHRHLGEGLPLLWETMTFGEALPEEQERYTSAAEATAGHLAMVERVRLALAADGGATPGSS